MCICACVCFHFLSRSHFEDVNKTLRQSSLFSGVPADGKGAKKAGKKRDGENSSRLAFVYAIESSVHAYSRLAYNAPSRIRVQRVVQRVCAHADRAACVRACMNARSSISDAYKCAPSVSRPRVLSHDKTLSDARAYAFGSYRVPSRLHCPLELYYFLTISTPLFVFF